MEEPQLQQVFSKVLIDKHPYGDGIIFCTNLLGRGLPASLQRACPVYFLLLDKFSLLYVG